jgi:hypothetical protein
MPVETYEYRHRQSAADIRAELSECFGAEKGVAPFSDREIILRLCFTFSMSLVDGFKKRDHSSVI